VSVEQQQRLDDVRAIVNRYFPVDDAWWDGQPTFIVRILGDPAERFLRLKEQLEPLGYLPVLRHRDGVTVVGVLPRPPQARWRWQVNLALFAATLVTTFLAGYLNAGPLVARGLMSSAVAGGVAFSLSLILILGTHEMGHKIVSKLRGIDASYPYFIPMLPPVGTMGAVIVTRTPAPNRDALMELGASGPIAGFLVAIPVLILGIKMSFLLPGTLPEGAEMPVPLLVRLLTAILRPEEQTGTLLMHPVFFAGWIGLLVTSLNLLPASMLDGGHAVRALFGARIHRMLSYGAIGLGLLLGYFPMVILLLLLLRRGHPGPLDDLSPMSRSRVALGVMLLVIFILSATRLQF